MSGGARIGRRAVLAGGAAAAIAATAGPLLARARAARQLTLRGPDGRAIPVTEWRPDGRVKGTILFSHGALSAPRYYPQFVAAWVASGHRVLAPLHVDSQEHPRTREFAGLASWKARIEDMRAIIAHIGPAPFTAAGHSYGGLVALTLGGAEAIPPAGLDLPLVPRLARAVVAFSPPAPIPVLVTETGYAALKVPALIQTGTRDLMPGGTAPDGWMKHLVPYFAPPAGGLRYGLVLEGVDHYFGGAICDYSQPGPRMDAQVAVAARMSDLFVAAYGDGDGRARRTLDRLVSEALPTRLMRR